MRRKPMTQYTTETLTEGETVAVTLLVGGNENEGELTVENITGNKSAYVTNGNGDKFELNFYTSVEDDLIATLNKHGDTLAEVVALEGY